MRVAHLSPYLEADSMQDRSSVYSELQQYVVLCTDIEQLTKKLSEAVRPDISEAKEVIKSVYDRLGTGKRGKKVRDLLAKTLTVIREEIIQPKFDAVAFRKRMKTENAEWQRLVSEFNSEARLASSDNNITQIQIGTGNIPKQVPKGKTHISFRYPIIFTNKAVIAKETLMRMPEKYKAAKYGSGYRFDSQLVLAFTNPGTDAKAAEYASDLIDSINNQEDAKIFYTPALQIKSGNITRSWFRSPGSSLLYVWLIPRKIAEKMKVQIISAQMHSAELDNNQKPASNADVLRIRRERLEALIQNDETYNELMAQKKTAETLGRSKVAAEIEAKIEARKKALTKKL